MNSITRAVLIGGPGTGKTSVINALKEKGYNVLPEISRQVTIEAQKKGIDQLFLTDPLAFSDRLLEGRVSQYEKATSGLYFYDRGIPDVPAYHRFTGDLIPKTYIEKSQNLRYDYCFYFPVWDEIYQQDSERYENLDQAKKISGIIKDEYESLGYDVIDVPKTSIEDRVAFILKHLNP